MAEFIISPVSSSRSSLIRPLDEQAVLVPDEQVYYAERQHWASIVQPVYETFIFLLFTVWVVDLFNSTDMGTGWISAILLGAVIHAVILAVTGGRTPRSRLAADPFSNPAGKGVSRAGILAIGLLMVLVVRATGFQGAGIAAVVVVVTRLIVILARWSFYERRYITNRRVIESGGFLGSRISSMPLSRVTDINYSRTVPGEVFGYATMRVETAGQDQALGVVRYISEPDHFYEVLINFSAPQASSSEG
jgi:uncharacterized membrane protein YdbT with pleckstrin-like domain